MICPASSRYPAALAHTCCILLPSITPASAWTWKHAKLAPTCSCLPCLLLPLEKFVLDIFSWSAPCGNQFSPQRSPHEGHFPKNSILNGLLLHPSKLGFLTSLFLTIREPLALWYSASYTFIWYALFAVNLVFSWVSFLYTYLRVSLLFKTCSVRTGTGSLSCSAQCPQALEEGLTHWNSLLAKGAQYQEREPGVDRTSRLLAAQVQLVFSPLHFGLLDLLPALVSLLS